jgi:hypothetical protein
MYFSATGGCNFLRLAYSNGVPGPWNPTTTKERHMSKHTPGPWAVAAGANPKNRVIYSVNGAGHPHIAVTVSHDFADGCEPDFANAALIAAAPELLAAALDAYKWLAEIHAAGGHTRSDARFHALGAAVAKAEG